MRVGTQDRFTQALLPGLSPIASAIEVFAEAGTDDRGAVFTRREVVDFILDLVDYVPSNNLQTARFLEPSFGHGDFLIPAIERLMVSLKRQGIDLAIEFLIDCIRGVEIHAASSDKIRNEIREILLHNGLALAQVEKLLDTWLIQGDFLLTSFGHTFTHVVGNPPYIRQEMIPAVLMAEYRRRHKTIYDRADIYVPFIERSLSLLDDDGVLGFICADRWMKNRYGGPLREFVANNFHLRTYVDMVGVSAFHSKVIAYPAIMVIAKESFGPTCIAARPEIEAQFLRNLAEELMHPGRTKSSASVRVAAIGRDDSPWVLDDSDSLTLVRRLEQDFPLLEETGCKVGIGVATGADDVFIAPFETLDVEEDRKLPLAMTKDIQSGSIEWRGYGVVNPFGDDGKLVSLTEYPRLRAHFDLHENVIRQRHVSKKNPAGWYRTIDRIYPELVQKPKLLIPDIKGDAHIVYEEGNFYPHHNLYYIVSDEWDLQALRAVLLSGIARLFIGTYSTRMHGNCLRFQAQYLRRIRLPHWDTVSSELRRTLRLVAENNDHKAREQAVSELYKLSALERATISA